MRRSALSIAFATLAFGVAAAPAAAQDAAGLTFRETRPLTLDSPAALSRVGDQLTVCNGGARDATGLKAAAAGFAFQDAKGAPAVDRDVVGVPTIPDARLGPGACMVVSFAAVKGAPTLGAGPYTGEVTVSSAGQGVARRELTIAGPVDRSVAPRAVVDTVKIKVTQWSGPFHNWLGLGSDDHDASVPLHAPQRGRSLRIAGDCRKADLKSPDDGCPVIGVVAHNDTTGQLSLRGPLDKSRERDGVVVLPVRLHEATSVGDYAGSIDPGNTGEDDDAIAVVVSTTQGWVWALIALLLGCGFTLCLQLRTQRNSPAAKVHEDAGALVQRYHDAERAFHKGRRFSQITGPDDVRTYADGVNTALDNYLRGMVFLDKDTDTYKSIDTSLRNADDDIACLGEPDQLRASLDGLTRTRSDLLEWLRTNRFSDEEPAIATEAAKLLARQTLKVGAAVKLKAAADAEVATLDTWKKLAEEHLHCWQTWRALAGTAARPPGDGGMEIEDARRHVVARARLAQAKDDMMSARDADELAERWVKKRLDRVYDELGYLEGRYPPEPAGADGYVELAGYWPESGAPAFVESMLSMPSVLKDVRTIETLLDGVRADRRTSARPAEIRSSKRWVGDVLLIVLSQSVALLGAVIGLVSDKNFGTVSDYVTVILIGTTAQGIVGGAIPSINAVLQDRLGSVLDTDATDSRTVSDDPPDPPPSDDDDEAAEPKLVLA